MGKKSDDLTAPDSTAPHLSPDSPAPQGSATVPNAQADQPGKPGVNNPPPGPPPGQAGPPQDVGPVLHTHLQRFKEHRHGGGMANMQDQKADERALRHFVAGLILSQESTVLSALTEAEQVQARNLAAKLQNS